VFLPHLIESGDGHVINISSVFGLFSVPGQAAYNAAKFAVRGFTEALRQEMELAGHPVKVTTVHPGGIKTNIVRNMTAVETVDKDQLTHTFDKKLANTSPEKAARIILDGVRKNRARVLVGPDSQGAGPHRPRDRLGIPAAVLDGDVADGARSALMCTNAANLCA
jgi:short-subunit dehydrogenase